MTAKFIKDFASMADATGYFYRMGFIEDKKVLTYLDGKVVYDYQTGEAVHLVKAGFLTVYAIDVTDAFKSVAKKQREGTKANTIFSDE